MDAGVSGAIGTDLHGAAMLTWATKGRMAAQRGVGTASGGAGQARFWSPGRSWPTVRDTGAEV
jgi:hypothetical protein